MDQLGEAADDTGIYEGVRRMSRRFGIAAASATIALACVSSVAAGASQSAAPGPTIAHHTAARQSVDRAITIRVTSTTTAVKFLVDRAPKNKINKGDVLWMKSRLHNAVAQFNKPRGALVGSDVSTATMTGATAANIKVKATLPGGKVSAAGSVNLAGAKEVIRVTGGTGAFAGARGTTEASPTSGDRALNVYRLQLP